MSHVVSIKTELTDLEAVKAACRELGLIFKPGQTTFKWWGRSEGDYPIPAGMRKADLGQCDHAIGVPGTEWEIGLVRQANGAYKLAFDFYGHRGQPILDALGGQEAGRFLQAYGVNKTIMTARKLGHNAVRVMGKNGAVNVIITGRL